MKLILKGDAFVAPTPVNFANVTPSLSELKCRIAKMFGLQKKELRNVTISMNGKEALTCEDFQTLSSLGFVSGDFVYIFGLQPAKCFNSEIPFQILVNVQRDRHGFFPVNLSNLLPEVLRIILCQLDVQSLCSLSATSHFFKAICDHSSIWKHLAKRDLGITTFQHSILNNWKKVYKYEFAKAQQRIYEREARALCAKARTPYYKPTSIPVKCGVVTYEYYQYSCCPPAKVTGKMIYAIY